MSGLRSVLIISCHPFYQLFMFQIYIFYGDMIIHFVCHLQLSLILCTPFLVVCSWSLEIWFFRSITCYVHIGFWKANS